MTRTSLATGALALAVALGGGTLAFVAPPAASAEEVASAFDLTGSVVDGRASLNWNDIAGARDYVIFDVSAGEPGAVKGATRTSEWLSARLPGRDSFSFRVVARDGAKQEIARSGVFVLYPNGAPTDPPPEEPEEPTDPPPEEPEEPTDPPPTDPEEPTDPGTLPLVRDEPVDLGVAVRWNWLQEPTYAATVDRYFTSITAENETKPRLVHPEPERYDFTVGDQIANWAYAHGKEFRLHTLFWHGANPSWVTNGSYTPEQWQEFIRDHATTIAGHYDQVTSIDVLNEIVAEDGVGPNGDGLRTDNPWVEGATPPGGDRLDAIALMFEATRAANPTARLCLNDFSVEFNRPKTQAYLNLVRDLKARGVPVDCVGFQAHLITEQEAGTSDPGGWSPSLPEWTGILNDFAAEGVTVQVTEADLKTSPTAGTTQDKLQAHAEQFAILAEGCQAVEACTEFTVWTLRDQDSWLYNNGAEMPVLFTSQVTDGLYTPKPALAAVQQALNIQPTTPTEPEPPVEEPTDPTPPTAEPTREWDVDAGDSIFDVWPEIHAPLHERVTVSTEQVFPGEDASIKFVTNRADVMGNPGANSTWNPGNTGTRRAEVRDSIAASGNIGEGTDQWWSWATYFPADFNWGERNQFFGFMQFHQTANSGNPPVHFWVDEQENMMLDVRGGTGGRTSGDAQYTERFNLGPVALGAWNDIQAHFVWSSDPNVGLVEVYRGGELVLSENAANLYSGQSAYVKQGIYSANGTADEPVQTIYTSTTRLGDSRESVLPRAEG